MKTLSILVLLCIPAFVQGQVNQVYVPVPPTFFPAVNNVIDSKPSFTSGSGAPTSLCTTAKDMYLSSTGSFYVCTATNTWTLQSNGSGVIPSTTSVLKGDGTGGAAAITGTGPVVVTGGVATDPVNTGAVAVNGSGITVLRDFTSVLDYGADPTGSVDATAIFGTANAASKRVIVPAGTYKINNWVPLTGTSVECAAGATLRRSSAVAVFTASNASVSFHNCIIDGNSFAANLADITGAHFLFDHCTGQNSATYGIFFNTGGDFAKVSDSTFLGNTFAPIVSGGSTQGGVVIGNDITQSSGSDNSENKAIQLHATGGSGVMQNWTVTGNTMRFTADADNGMCIEWWRAGGSSDITLNYTGTGNTCYASAHIFACYSISGGINSTVSGNTCNVTSGVSYAGIEVTDSRHTVVADNTVTILNSNSGTFGIVASDKSIDSDVHDNYIYADIPGGQFIRIYGDSNFGEQAVAYRINVHDNHIVFLDGATGEGIATSFCNSANCTGNNVTIHHNTITGVGGTGNATWSGTAVTWFNGDQFRGVWAAPVPQVIKLNGSDFTIVSVNSPTSITIASSAGTQSVPVPFTVSVLDGSFCMSEDVYFPQVVNNLKLTDNTCKNINQGINRTPNVQTSYLLNNTFDNVTSFYTGTGGGGEIRTDPVQGSYSTPGAITQNVTAATNATPVVLTVSLPHSVTDGEPVLTTGIQGNTNANGSYFAKVTSYTSTTFALYNDAALTSPVAGSGAFTGTSGWAIYGGSSLFQVNGQFNSQDFSGLMTCNDNTGNLNHCTMAANYKGFTVGQHGITFGNWIGDLPRGDNNAYNPGTLAPGASTFVTVGATGCVAGSPAFASFSLLTTPLAISITAFGYAGSVAVNITNLSGSPWTPGAGTLRVTCIVYGVL